MWSRDIKNLFDEGDFRINTFDSIDLNRIKSYTSKERFRFAIPCLAYAISPHSDQTRASCRRLRAWRRSGNGLSTAVGVRGDIVSARRRLCRLDGIAHGRPVEVCSRAEPKARAARPRSGVKRAGPVDRRRKYSPGCFYLCYTRTHVD